jgi:hypothetical protein
VTEIAAADSDGDRPARGIKGVADWFRRYWLGVWFAIMSGIWLILSIRHGAVPGDDLYLDATRRLLHGVDPWSTPYPGDWWFGAPPISLLPVVPFALLPPDVGRVMLMAVAIGAGIATVRALKLPWYWILFPPLVDAMWTGNIQAWLVPLILVGQGWLAVLAKVYAAVPLLILGRWRPLAIAVAIIIVTAPFLPWVSYLSQSGAIYGHLRDQAGGLSAPPYLIPLAVLALIVMGRARAAWMTVPAIWPSTQWYYNTLAIPALTPIPAALMAVPSSWCVVGACVVLAIERRRSIGHVPAVLPEPLS